MSRGQRSTECAILRPVLVALVHDEPHPETWRLVRHLARCPDCMQERADLEETLAVVNGVPLADVQCLKPRAKQGGAAVGRPTLLLQGMLAVAGIVVATILVCGEVQTPTPASRSRALEAPAVVASPNEPGSPTSDYMGRALDDALDRIERRLESMGGIW